jgi:hypothetical protein
MELRLDFKYGSQGVDSFGLPPQSATALDASLCVRMRS